MRKEIISESVANSLKATDDRKIDNILDFYILSVIDKNIRFLFTRIYISLKTIFMFCLLLFV